MEQEILNPQIMLLGRIVVPYPVLRTVMFMARVLLGCIFAVSFLFPPALIASEAPIEGTVVIFPLWTYFVLVACNLRKAVLHLEAGVAQLVLNLDQLKIKTLALKDMKASAYLAAELLVVATVLYVHISAYVSWPFGNLSPENQFLGCDTSQQILYHIGAGMLYCWLSVLTGFLLAIGSEPKWPESNPKSTSAFRKMKPDQPATDIVQSGYNKWMGIRPGLLLISGFAVLFLARSFLSDASRAYGELYLHIAVLAFPWALTLVRLVLLQEQTVYGPLDIQHKSPFYQGCSAYRSLWETTVMHVTGLSSLGTSVLGLTIMDEAAPSMEGLMEFMLFFVLATLMCLATSLASVVYTLSSPLKEVRNPLVVHVQVMKTAEWNDPAFAA